MYKFIKLEAVIGRADDQSITAKEQEAFVDKFVEFIESEGYETCALWELVEDEKEEENNVAIT